MDSEWERLTRKFREEILNSVFLKCLLKIISFVNSTYSKANVTEKEMAFYKVCPWAGEKRNWDLFLCLMCVPVLSECCKRIN